ncbi:3-hydroxyacyl-ACP dehydratase FabZ [Vulgatibacter sp.]|uniref:3-hydroxyacyl-ACP dehydratase FabZ n=1 Tax=Vulgatibacter sp. TaxID=1971226 RepID=UPI00356A37F7
MNIEQIQEILPHRYPFLLVDRVVEMEPGVRIKAFKNVTVNEQFFNGHFPGHPVMPGVLIVEALAQAVALLAAGSSDVDMRGRVIYLAGVDNARFRQPVKPGDRLDLEGTVIKRKGPLWKLQGIATVDGKKVAEAELMATLANK